METYSHFETKRLSYTDLRRVTASSVFVTKILSNFFPNRIKMKINDFPSKILKKSFESGVKSRFSRESRNKQFFFLGLTGKHNEIISLGTSGFDCQSMLPHINIMHPVLFVNHAQMPLVKNC